RPSARGSGSSLASRLRVAASTPGDSEAPHAIGSFVMTPRPVVTLAALAGLPALVPAQSFTNDSHITFGLTWSEATSTGAPVPSPNGVLGPEEYALLTVTPVAFTNQ